MTRPITDTLRHIGGGVFVDTASAKLQELVSAVDETGKSGRIDQKKLDLQSVPADTRQPIALKG